VFLRDSSPAPPDRSLLIKVNKNPCIGFKVNVVHMGIVTDMVVIGIHITS